MLQVDLVQVGEHRCRSVNMQILCEVAMSAAQYASAYCGQEVSVVINFASVFSGHRVSELALEACRRCCSEVLDSVLQLSQTGCSVV
jgi:hypothetical protein